MKATLPISELRFYIYLQIYMSKISKHDSYETLREQEFERIAEFRPLPTVSIESIKTDEVEDIGRLQLEEIQSEEVSLSDMSDFVSRVSSGLSAFSQQMDDEVAYEVLNKQPAKLPPSEAFVQNPVTPVNDEVSEKDGHLASSEQDLSEISKVSSSEQFSEASELESWKEQVDIKKTIPDLTDSQIESLLDGFEDRFEHGSDTENEEELDEFPDDSMSSWDDEEDEVSPVTEDFKDDLSDWSDDSEWVDSDSSWDDSSEEVSIGEDTNSWSDDYSNDDDSSMWDDDTSTWGDDSTWEDNQSAVVKPAEEGNLSEEVQPSQTTLWVSVFRQDYIPKRPVIKPALPLKKKATTVKANDVTPRPEVVAPKATAPVYDGSMASQFVGDRLPHEDLLAYTRRKVRVSESEALNYFSPKEIEVALKNGNLLRKKGILIFAHM